MGYCLMPKMGYCLMPELLHIIVVSRYCDSASTGL